ncbi:MAG: hypothetical protein KGO94_03605 [Alphaproteobacteria bacterium]|nr:hypothetical protein [Alphaproteobacteria bacterium]
MKALKLTVATAVLFGTFAIPAFADATIAVSLWNNAETVDLSKNLGMVPGSKMDMSKAPMGIKAEPAEVPAGKVTFNVTNVSKDMIHEMILSPTPNKDAALPYVDNENRANEEKAGHLGEVSELDPGKTGALTVDLKPGIYVLYCNIPGHLGAGMWTTVTVK